MEDIKKRFFDIVTARSNENEKALNLLLKARCYALVGAIIRLELDSLVRVHYFNNADDNKQGLLLHSFFNEGKWNINGKRIFDINMVDILTRSLGWAIHIYHFCCAFIHLSPYHDWASTSNIPNLTYDKRKFIVSEIKLQQYDTTLKIDEDFGFNELMPFAPHIFKKLRDNLLYEMKNKQI